MQQGRRVQGDARYAQQHIAQQLDTRSGREIEYLHRTHRRDVNHARSAPPTKDRRRWCRGKAGIQPRGRHGGTADTTGTPAGYSSTPSVGPGGGNKHVKRWTCSHQWACDQLREGARPRQPRRLPRITSSTPGRNNGLLRERPGSRGCRACAPSGRPRQGRRRRRHQCMACRLQMAVEASEAVATVDHRPGQPQELVPGSIMSGHASRELMFTRRCGPAKSTAGRSAVLIPRGCTGRQHPGRFGGQQLGQVEPVVVAVEAVTHCAASVGSGPAARCLMWSESGHGPRSPPALGAWPWSRLP